MSISEKDTIEKLVKDHLRFVHFILKRYRIPENTDYEDMFQIGCVGLVKAAQKFDPTKGIKFTTFSAYAIESEIKKFLRKYRTAKRTGIVISVDQEGEESEGTLMDLLATFDSVEEEVEARLLYSELVRQEPVITMMALEGYNQTEIGRKLGISQSHVSRKILNMKKTVAIALC